MNSSILVIHFNLSDQVNSESGIVKMARYAKTSAQSRSLSCEYLNYLDNRGWSLRKHYICFVDGMLTIHIEEMVWRDIL